jgi:D-aminopeptidase
MISELPNNQVSPLFEASMEASEEAIYNALVAGVTTTGYKGIIEALPLDRVIKIIQNFRRGTTTHGVD